MYTKNNVIGRAVVVVALAIVALLNATRCDLLDAGYGLYDFGYGGYSYYDPTDTIQSVIDYRQDVYDWSNNAWDEYILQ